MLLVLAAALPAGSQETPATMGAGSVSPAQWPDSELASFGMAGWPNALRVFGGDAVQNSAVAALLMRGTGQFPFDSPDRTDGGVGGLSAASHWWGLGVCPRSVIVVAGDVSADAMTASALSDPTDGSSEPWLRRVAAADPLFDPVGGFARVDTYAAPILFVDSARAGAVSLPLSTRIAAADMRSGGCRAARQAVIVGGTAAVPAAAESELVALGFAGVFRVAGAETPDGAGPFGVSTVRGLPLGAGAYATTLSMSPVYRHSSTGGVSEAGAVPLGVCLPRASYANARWLVAETGADTSGLAALDLSEAGWYLADGDGVVRSTATGTPSCLDVDVPAAVPLVARAVSSVGRTTRSLLVAAEPQRRMSLWGPVRARFAQASDVRSDRPLDVGVSTWEFATGAAGGAALLAATGHKPLATGGVTRSLPTSTGR